MSLQIKFLLIAAVLVLMIVATIQTLNIVPKTTPHECGDIVWQDWDEYGNVKVTIRECELSELTEDL